MAGHCEINADIAGPRDLSVCDASAADNLPIATGPKLSLLMVSPADLPELCESVIRDAMTDSSQSQKNAKNTQRRKSASYRGFPDETLVSFAPGQFQIALLRWYDKSRRDLPWRAKPGEIADPYRVWLSEIMLQQTTVKAVAPYFEAFIRRWPTVRDLADAPRDDVLTVWAGLGYYSRARNLHACAQVLASGGFPQTENALRDLPGIGPYTAAAIAAIAFNAPATVVDGNVERVISRLFALETPLPEAKPQIRALAARLTAAARPGDYAQAMMDLGATICTPRSPSCLVCPVEAYCNAKLKYDPSRFPIKHKKSERPVRQGFAFVLVEERSDGPHVYLRQRPDKGLLGGMIEAPCSAWVESNVGRFSVTEALVEVFREEMRPPHPVPLPAGARDRCGSDCDSGEWIAAGVVRHTFTHFHLELTVYAIRKIESDGIVLIGGMWAPLSEIGRFALPSVMQKALAKGLAALRHNMPG